MTLSNNAIKFLQAQYRAIFKRAYVKGLATAVLLTAGLAAGQAQAVELSTGANAESDIITQGSGDTFNVSSETTVNSITIQTGHSLTTSGGINVTGDVTANGDLTIESGAILLANKETVGENENQTIYRHDFTSTGSDLNLSGNIGAASFSVSDGTLELTAGGEGNTNLTAYGSGWNQDQASGNATDYDRDTANGKVLGMTVTVNAGTNVAALNLLTVDDNSKITLAGSGSSSGVTADNTAYLEGSRQIAISDTEITVNGYANGIFSQNGSISDSSIKINENAKLLIAGNADDYTNVLSGTDQANVATYSLTNTDITNAGTLQLGTSGSNDFTITGGSMSNTGTVIVNADELSVTDEYFNGLFTKGTGSTQGKLNFSGNAINVDGEVDLNGLGIINSSNGSLDSNRLGLKAEGATFTTDTVSLKGFYTADELDLDVGTLNVEGTAQGGSSPKKIRFEMASGTTITVHDSLSGSNAIEQFVIKATDTGDTTSLILDAGANGGTITNIKNFHVGWDNSGSSVFTVKGTWDFGGSVIKAGSSGTVTIDGTANNVGELRLQQGGKTDVNGAMEIDRLLGSESGGGTLNINGTLTVTGDGTTETKNSDDEYRNDVYLTEATVNINNGGTFAITTADAVEDVIKVTTDTSTGEITAIEVPQSGSNTAEQGGWDHTKVNLKAGGTLQLNLAALGIDTITQDNLISLKESLVASGSQGSFDFGDGLTIQLDKALQEAIDSGEVSYSQTSKA